MAKRRAATERREEGRLSPGHVLPLSVVRDADNHRVACRLHDLSSDGMCVWVREPLATGTRVRFVTLKREYLLEVAWCDPAGAKELRCGLALAENEDMSQLFSGFLSAS